MARWAPDARLRLVVAAVDLFGEQGYDATTVAEIAQRAGVTKSTFFRHFTDKRELLSAGQAMLSDLLAAGIAEAPAGTTALDAVAAGLRRAATAMGPINHGLGPRIDAIVATSTELQERSLLKEAGLAAAMADALVGRGVAGTPARLAAEMGVLAFTRGFADWSQQADADADALAQAAVASLDELRLAAAALT
ncbi:TetR/AcrR family transcriptional regulator [Amnibacterium endophyticum]|uniref:TetR/AcrR family transcriptional regulator n=1 Tax=Amnibacterium endophyticum TaxID=2109337 RepID=A0ABW4LJF1_9MICO